MKTLNSNLKQTMLSVAFISSVSASALSFPASTHAHDLSPVHRNGSATSPSIPAEILENEYAVFEWYKEHAEKGDAESQFQLGLMYINGEGVTSDDYEAMKWLSRSAEQGHKAADFVYTNLLNNDFPIGC